MLELKLIQYLFPIRSAVAAKGQAQASVTMTAYRVGKRRLVACFQSEQLSGVRGEKSLDVEQEVPE